MRQMLQMGLMGLAFSVATAAGAQTKAAGKAEAPQTPMTQGLMRSIFVPLSEVLPYGFDRQAFADPKNRGYIEERLKALDGNVHLLETHATTQDRGFEFVARSLARDVKNLRRRYERGYFDEARFTLQNMTDNCIACHASLPENRKFPGADQFFAKVKIDQLPPVERARLQIVARNFDAAITSLESALEAPDLHPVNVVTLGSFTDYLRLNLAVKKDTKRPAALIDRLLARKDTPPHVRGQLERWKTALAEIERSKVLETGRLAEARKLMDEGRKLMEFPRDRDGLVHYVAASGLLADYVHTRPDRGRDVAEAYYLMGIADSLLENSFWISRMEFDFESAIRLAPDADFAPKAYALLEEAMIVGFSGSMGTKLPDDVTALLQELRQIIADARGAKKS